MSDNKKVLIRHTEISNKSQFVLIALGVHTVDDLHLMYLLDTIPTVGTNINLYPFVKASLIYTEAVNEEVKTLLKVYCGIEELENVGV